MTKAVKISVALDKKTIAIADKRAAEEHSNRSQIIRKALLLLLSKEGPSPQRAA